jgi:hypothetical protein
VGLPVDDLPRVVHVLDAEREEEPDVDVADQCGLDPRRHPMELLGHRDDMKTVFRTLAQHVGEGWDRVVMDLVKE